MIINIPIIEDIKIGKSESILSFSFAFSPEIYDKYIIIAIWKNRPENTSHLLGCFLTIFQN